MKIIDCGIVAFREAMLLQARLAAAIAVGREDETLLILEHPTVYTIGCGGDRANILDSTVTVERISRGGDVTWHGPGQIVGYPLFNLGRRGRDLHRWLKLLEEVLIATLASLGISAWSCQSSSGVWSGHGKIAFIGVGVRRWVTMHGFSLNVNADLRCFDKINPCGIAGCPVTSMALELDGDPPHAAVKQEITANFTSLLGERLPPVDGEEGVGGDRCQT